MRERERGDAGRGGRRLSDGRRERSSQAEVTSGRLATASKRKLLESGISNLATKLGQIGPKWKESVTF